MRSRFPVSLTHVLLAFGACASPSSELGSPESDAAVTTDATPGTGSGICGEQLSTCAGTCVNLTNDPEHCGECGGVCAGGQVCSYGQCRPRCEGAEQTACDDSCVDLTSDVLHCGSCGSACALLEACLDGACVCAAGSVDCDGVCISLLTDARHCGACGTRCGPFEACEAGVCVGGILGGAAGVTGAAGSPGVPIVAPRATFPQLMGWASVSAMGQDGTHGGGDLPITEVDTFEDLQAAVGGNEPAVVRASGSLNGTLEVGSNKTLFGAPGFELIGTVHLIGSVNVILSNLRLIGQNCADGPCGEDREADTLSVRGGAHHIWLNHLDISDATDGNLDIIEASDYITVSWTRFSYSSSNREYRFSNLVGNDEQSSSDSGHLKVTFHHNWWAENVMQRMPRVRFGQVHLFNNLYTSTGNNYCIGVGVDANILAENNVFVGVNDPIETALRSGANSVIVSRGNSYEGTSGAVEDLGDDVFQPPYPYLFSATENVESEVRASAGVH